VKNWSLQETLDDTAKAGVDMSILSVTTPQVQSADIENARCIPRDRNEPAAKLGQSHPGRFGSLARLPMQDTDSALRELGHANVSQVLSGCKYPFRSGGDHVKGLAAEGYGEAEVRAIGRHDAARLMARWQA